LLFHVRQAFEMRAFAHLFLGATFRLTACAALLLFAPPMLSAIEIVPQAAATKQRAHFI
jgi:hypothetical protein